MAAGSVRVCSLRIRYVENESISGKCFARRESLNFIHGTGEKGAGQDWVQIQVAKCSCRSINFKVVSQKRDVIYLISLPDRSRFKCGLITENLDQSVKASLIF